MTERSRSGPPIVVTAVVAALVVLVMVVLADQPWRHVEVDTEPAAAETRTVTRGSLVAEVVLAAEVSHGDPATLVGSGGIVTALPRPGEVIRPGEQVHEVDGRPVVLVRGERPFWRDLESGVRPGPDVEQLEQLLVDLGFGDDLTVDDTFTWYTARALRAWQESLGVERTGRFSPADAVVTSAEAIRVDTLHVALGEQADGFLLDHTDTTLRAYANLASAQSSWLTAGTPVTVEASDGARLDGVVAEVETDRGLDDDRRPLPDRVVIDVDDASRLAGLGGSARVIVSGDAVDDVLVVPVTALLALSDGGYGVEVVRDGRPVLVPVEVGLVADARVQVAEGLEEGDEVVVP